MKKRPFLGRNGRYLRINLSDWGEKITHAEGQEVIDKVVAAFQTQSKEIPINIQRLIDPTGQKGVYRIQLAFEVGIDLVNEFFNTPQGIRGHYYHSPELGDDFTRRCISALSGQIKLRWQPTIEWIIDQIKPPKPLELDPAEVERVRKISLDQWGKWFDCSLENGKIWPTEQWSEKYPRTPLFQSGEDLKKEWDQYRWLYSEALEQVAEENIKNLKEAIKKRGGGDVPESYYEQRAVLGSKKPLSWKALDIKGGWVDPITLIPWTHPSKMYRALQIHHLGFS